MKENQAQNIKDLKKSSERCEVQTSNSQCHVNNKTPTSNEKAKNKDNPTLMDQNDATGNTRLSMHTNRIQHVTVQKETRLYKEEYATVNKTTHVCC